MVKRKPPDSKNRRSSAQSGRSESDAKKADDSWLSPAAMRETVESVIIAFVLAFLFRTFEAEAFVIPTGSMAPTLMGKHKDFECPMCHFRYQVSASDHADREHPDEEKPATIYRATCPMCRFTADLVPPQSFPSYDGDRILVAKFPYEFADPKRWDIVVFKYPGNATMNYIKRLVGLPGETIRIRDGDLWLRQANGQFKIARKPPEKLLAMLQLVYDNDLAPTITGKLGWPARWTAETDNTWTSKDPSSFEIDGSANGEIRYRHRVPGPGQWENIASADGKRIDKLTPSSWEDLRGGNKIPADDVKPQFITDFTAYNTGESDESRSHNVSPSLLEQGYGLHWVGDLAVQFQLESKSASGGEVVAELIKGGCHFRCRFDLTSGKAELTILDRDGREVDGYHRTAATAMIGAGRHSVIFANVDDELTLWIDDKVVAFQDPTKPAAAPPRAGQSESEGHPNQYDSALLNDHVRTAEDLSPVRISAKAASVKVSHIKVFRDVYYIAVFSHGDSKMQVDPLRDSGRSDSDSSSRPRSKESDQDGNDILIELKADPAHPEKDQFFVLGDNSAKSSDGRLWIGQWYVERELLIGKALFIYWPHGWGIPYVPLPFNPIPYFQRMHLVR